MARITRHAKRIVEHTSATLAAPVRRFLKRHGRCGSLTFDTPAAPDRIMFRLLLACSCGDTFEALVGSLSLDVSEVQALLRRAG